MQLALIKAWQHSPCPTALFTLSGSARRFLTWLLLPSAREAWLPLGSGRMGKGSQPLPRAAGHRGGMGSPGGSSPRGVWPSRCADPGRGKRSHHTEGKLPPHGVLGCSAVPDSRVVESQCEHFCLQGFLCEFSKFSLFLLHRIMKSWNGEGEGP